MTATKNATATITQTINVSTYEQASNYVNEQAARTAAEKSPKDIEVGDIIYANFGYTMTLPVFGRVIKRTPCTYVIEELPSKEFGSDRYGQQGLALPVLDGSSRPAHANRRLRANRFTKSGNLSWDGHYATLWDGKARWYDYMD